MKSYGLMGGTFDPIHLGHLRTAENAREALGLDRVVFVPSGIPPHRGGTAAPAHDRLLMAELATSAHPHFTCSDVELTRAGRSYTVDTLEQLRAAEPGIAWTLVVGADAYAEIGSWREPERILALCRLAVVERPGSGETPGLNELARLETVFEGPVWLSDIDTNRHVNNAQFAKWIGDCSSERQFRNRRYTSIHINNLEETLLGDMIALLKTPNNDLSSEYFVGGVSRTRGSTVFHARVIWV